MLKDQFCQLRKNFLLSLFVSVALVTTQSALAVETLNENDKNWQKLQQSGTRAFENMEYGNAERQLTAAMSLAREFPAGDVRLAKSCGELGRLLSVRARFAEAEPLLEEELNISESANNGERGKLIPLTAALIRFYMTNGTASKADQLTDDLLSFVLGRYKIVSGDLQNKVKKGTVLEGWAGTAPPVMRDPLLEWSITCDQLGNLYSAHKRYQLADQLYQASLDIKTTILGKQHLSLAGSYDNLGSLCEMRDELEDAETYYRDALDITEAIQPKNDPQVFNRLDKLARCLVKEGKLEEAEQLYLRSKTFWKSESSRSYNEARADYALGSIYIMLHNYAAAAQSLHKALKITEAVDGSSSISLVPYLQRYAYVLYYLGRRGESEQLKARAQAIAPDAIPFQPEKRASAPKKKGKRMRSRNVIKHKKKRR